MMMAASADASRMFQELQSRSVALAERERSMQQKRAALADLRNQVQNASEAAQRDRVALQSATQKFLETKRMVDEKVQAKEKHNQMQKERVTLQEQQEEIIKQQIVSTQASIDQTIAAIAKKQREGAALSESEERLTAVKLRLEEEDSALMHLETSIGRQEASALRRHNHTMETLPSYPLPQVSAPSTYGGLEATATDSIILVDDIMAKS